MSLSILIPTIPDRKLFLERLLYQITEQLAAPKLTGGLTFGINRWIIRDVELLIFIDKKENTIGKKRNELLKAASNKYLAFIDDDDRISDDYFKRIFEGIEKDVDCCSLTGVITEDGKNPHIFQHSTRYSAYKTNEGAIFPEVKYERFPNHLNTIRSSIAKLFRFPEKNHGEDTDFATQLFKSGAIKTECWIEEPIYFYDYISNK